ncbi:MAG: hypothetical protein WBI63_00130 [Coriobacteriia bacterium]
MEPRTLNLTSAGESVAAHITFPEELPVGRIAVTEVTLNGVVQPIPAEGGVVVDGDSNGTPDVRISFDRAALEAVLDAGEQSLIVTGKVNGQAFSATDTLTVIDPGHEAGLALKDS